MKKLTAPASATSADGSSWPLFARLLAASIIAGLLAVFFTKLSRVLSGPDVWDDSYMCVRYVDNLLRTGKLAWNPDFGPTYGQTSLLNLLLILPIRFFLQSNATRTVIFGSMLSGAAFVALLICNVYYQAGASRRQRTILTLITLVLVGQGSGLLAAHFVGGMDTMFVVAYATLLIILAKSFEFSPTRRNALLFGFLAGAAYLARPDLMIYSVALVAAAVAAKHSRREGVLAVATMVVTVAIILFGCWAYFGTPVPLPFYAKGMHLYGPNVYELHKSYPAQELLNFVGDFRLLLFAVVLGVVLCRKSFTATDWALLAAASLYVAYYRFFVLQIMPYDSRFYIPALASIIYLAAKSTVLVYGRLSVPHRTIAQEFVLPWGGLVCALFYLDNFRNPSLFLIFAASAGICILLTYRKHPGHIVALASLLLVYLAIANNVIARSYDAKLIVLPLPIIAFLAYRFTKENGLYELGQSQMRIQYLRFGPSLLLAATLCWNVYRVGEPLSEFARKWQSPDVADVAHYQKGYTYLWTNLDQWSKYPDDLIIATTDVGLPGVLNPRKVVLDYAGLHDTEIARHGFKPGRFFDRHHPDVFYQPLIFYPEMSEALASDPFYNQNYESFPCYTLNPPTMVGISIYRHSKYYAAIRSMIVESQQGKKRTPHVLVIEDQDRYKSLFDPL